MKKIHESILKYLAVLAGTLYAALIPALARAQTTFNNPAKDTTIQQFISDFLVAVVQISLPILTLFIVYAGFQFVIARGNPDALAKAKKNIVWVVLGAILILGAWVLASLIASTASQVLGS